MKKLVFTAAVAAMTGGLMAIESANIVGYDQVGINSVARYSGGATFVPITGSGVVLGDIIATDMDPDMDYIQILASDATVAVQNRYTYFSKELADMLNEDESTDEYTALIGWWEFGAVGDTSRDAVVLPVGQGWLLLNSSGSNIKFQYAGEVPQTTTQIETEGVARPFIANYLPRAITLGELVIDEFDPDMDYLQELNTDASVSVINRYSYFSQDLADELNADEETDEYDALVGWWDQGKVGDDGYQRDAVSIPSGKAFLGLCGSSGAWVVKFPAAN